MLKGCFIILFSLITFATYASGFIGVFNKKNKVIEYYETEEGDDYDDQQQVLLNEADSLISESVKQIDFSAARDSLTDTLIVVPETLADDIDTMLADWFLRNHTYVDSTCVSADYIAHVPDSVYKIGRASCREIVYVLL